MYLKCLKMKGVKPRIKTKCLRSNNFITLLWRKNIIFYVIKLNKASRICDYLNPILWVDVGATDSAVPCAMMINLATVMKKELRHIKGDVGLKFIFFDGEEAFHEWGPKDSIYGARHLATRYENQQERTRSGYKVTHLDRIDLLVLLDLLGAPHPHFYSFFEQTNKWYALLYAFDFLRIY